MHKDDSIRLRHMCDAAKEAVSYALKESRDSLNTNRMLALSLVRLIEVIGEAAHQVTTDFQKEHGEIPWAQIIAMRNCLIHAYFDIPRD